MAGVDNVYVVPSQMVKVKHIILEIYMTHCDLVRLLYVFPEPRDSLFFSNTLQRSDAYGSDIGLFTWSAPSHYLNQWMDIIYWTLRHKLQWNINRNSWISIQENSIKMSSAKCWPFCLSLNVLRRWIVILQLLHNYLVCIWLTYCT